MNMDMLDRWRRRMGRENREKHTGKSTEALAHSKKISQQDKLHTKVAYQYPKKAPFRFPVIPDQAEPQRKTEVPAYKRRQRQTEEQTESLDYRTPPKPKDDLTPEKSKEPFKPTEVASPIYGYQKRTRLRPEVEQVPAYVRREQKQEMHENSASVNKEEKFDTEIEVPEQTALQQEEPVTELNEIKETVEHEQPVDMNQKQEQAKERDTNKQLYTNEQQNDQHAKQTPKREIKSRRKKRQRSKQTHTQSPPVNVMMTPRDKYHLHKKKQAFERKHRPQQTPQKMNRQYELPYHLLNTPPAASPEDKVWVQEQQLLLEKTLKHFNVQAKVVHATQGPSVTRFEVQPELGVKVSRIRNLNDDIKLNMAAKDIRIEAPIPGKNTVGIEVPNLNPQMVGLREIFTTPLFQQRQSKLSIGLGLDVEGTPLVTDISEMPHGLIAGATGSGKSVCINTILISLMYKSHYDDVKFLLIDPKMVELAPYNDIPHLVSPVITDIKAATAALKWAVEEMEARYEKFVKAGVRDVNRYNEKMVQAGKPEEKLPFIVIVIDELADLMMMSPQDVEAAICRIAQKARACGMHLLLATQRPSVDVITGLIKANIPTRIAFSVSSQVDSRTIIDMNGAERLLGKGDMLFIENGSGKSRRLQGAFVSDEEIEKVTDHARTLAKPQYLFEEEHLLQQVEEDEEQDPLLDDVIEYTLKQNHVSTSLLQRQFRIGYNRAARLIDFLENKGMISGQNGSKPRDVLKSS